jgi:hypothetical protein
MFDFDSLKKETEALEKWLNEEKEVEFYTHSAGVKRRIEMGKSKVDHIKKLHEALGISPKMIEEEEKKSEQKVKKSLEEAKKILAPPEKILINEAEHTQNMQMLRSRAMAAGVIPGCHWWGGGNPYYCCGTILKHNEGGVTDGGFSCPGYAITGRKMHPWATAKGNGVIGYTDDNDVIVENTLWFAYWPDSYQFFKPLAVVPVHGWYFIHADDQLWNFKSAKLKVEIGIDVFQYHWAGSVWKTILSKDGKNIHDFGRMDNYYTLFGNPLLIAPGKWVLIPLTVRLTIQTQGSGSEGRLDFASPNYLSATMMNLCVH